jgi:hypothetical protein
MIDILNLFEAGALRLRQEGDEAETGKQGTLRGGNAGVITLDGKVLGKCARLSYLRMKGIKIEEKGTQAGLMFALGIQNEEDWKSKLVPVWEGTIKCEEEIPVKWTTSTGIDVTGRPDMVLCDKEGKPVHGIELKQLASLWTARDVGLELRPKVQHIIQAAHYSMLLDIPYSLVYTNRVNFAVSGEPWAQKLFPRKDQYTGDRLKFNDRDNVKDVLPFIQVYDLRWNDKGQLLYKASQHTEWTYTLVTKDGIRKYYESVAQMDSTNVLPDKPTSLRADGSKESFNACNYCPLNDTCSSTPRTATASDWLRLVKNGTK